MIIKLDGCKFVPELFGCVYKLKNMLYSSKLSTILVIQFVRAHFSLIFSGMKVTIPLFASSYYKEYINYRLFGGHDLEFTSMFHNITIFIFFNLEIESLKTSNLFDVVNSVFLPGLEKPQHTLHTLLKD